MKSLHLLPNIDEPPFLEIRTTEQWNEYQQRFLSQAPGELKRDFVRFVQLHRENGRRRRAGAFDHSQEVSRALPARSSVVVIHM